LQKRVQHLEQQIGKRYGFENILGGSLAIKESIDLQKEFAPQIPQFYYWVRLEQARRSLPRPIHQGSKRSGKLFMALNCSAFTKELL
jgi:transcriptional regulator with PAS, ATPase and Fis domain